MIYQKPTIMKKSIVILLILVTQFGIAGSNEKKISSRISEVTVFLNGAQVFRKGSTSLKKGTTKLVFNDVSPYINPKSIQASSTNGALILDVKHNIHYNEPPAVKVKVLPERIQKEIDQISDSLLYKQFELEMVTAKKKNLLNEKALITQNKTMRGEGRSDSLPVLMEAVKFYRVSLEEIEAKLFKVKMQEFQLKADNRKMKERLSELQRYNDHVDQPTPVKRKVHQVIVTVATDVETTSNIKINYLVSNAGWSPSYDLRAKDQSEPMQLTYKASVHQNTGEDWNNVKLTLSTFNQTSSLVLPSMASWELVDEAEKRRRAQQLAQQNRNQYANGVGYLSVTDSTMATAAYTYNTSLNTTMTTSFATVDNGQLFIEGPQGGYVAPPKPKPDEDFKMQQAQTKNSTSTFSNVEFKIRSRYSVSSDGENILMVISNNKLSSEFNHFSIPKVNKDAFLLARITDWEKMNLLKAKANIYFENTYVGETSIDPMMLSDTMELALGREKAIFTSRKKIEDEEKKTNMGKNISREITIELVVKNNKNSTVNMILKDQIPITKQEGVEITLKKDDGAKLEENTGTLKWNVKLAPKESKIIEFTYVIEYDKELDVL